MVLAKATTVPTSTLQVMVTAYTASSVFAGAGSGAGLTSGEYCVYKGTGTSTFITGLTASAAYGFKVYTRIGSTWSTGVSVNVTAGTLGGGDIIFTYNNSDGDGFEFMTLKRLNLTGIKFTDNGICAGNTFRTGETLSFPTDAASWSDVPCRYLLVRVACDNSGTTDIDATDGASTSNNNTGGLAFPGEQIIAYTGTAVGNSSCSATGTNTYISGVTYGASSTGWVSGATSTNNSKAPGTPTDFAKWNSTIHYTYSTLVTGDASVLQAAILDTTKWTN
jgi:hypothetical protein